MSQAQTDHRTHEPTRGPSILAGFLSYLVPGLGQIYQGRVGKGLMFAVILLGMFHFGESLGDWRNVYLPDIARDQPPFEGNPYHLQRPLVWAANIVHHRWHFLGQFWIGVAAWPAIFQYNDWPLPEALQNYQKMPKEDWVQGEERVPGVVTLNDYLRAGDKTADLAWVYTVIAGMLNILVIYDAFAGPAYGFAMGGVKQEPSVAANQPAVTG